MAWLASDDVRTVDAATAIKTFLNAHLLLSLTPSLQRPSCPEREEEKKNFCVAKVLPGERGGEENALHCLFDCTPGLA